MRQVTPPPALPFGVPSATRSVPYSIKLSIFDFLLPPPACCYNAAHDYRAICVCLIRISSDFSDLAIILCSFSTRKIGENGM